MGGFVRLCKELPCIERGKMGKHFIKRFPLPKQTLGHRYHSPREELGTELNQDVSDVFLAHV